MAQPSWASVAKRALQPVSQQKPYSHYDPNIYMWLYRFGASLNVPIYTNMYVSYTPQHTVREKYDAQSLYDFLISFSQRGYQIFFDTKRGVLVADNGYTIVHYSDWVEWSPTMTFC
jgi:hypothetical protein